MIRGRPQDDSLVQKEQSLKKYFFLFIKATCNYFGEFGKYKKHK